MPSLNLPRDILAHMTKGNALAIRQLEQIFDSAVGAPSSIEEANALAGAALAVAQANGALLVLLLEAVDRLDSMPAPVPHVEADDHAPRVHLGTMSSQDGDAVSITGGAVDGTPIGVAAAASGAFTTLGCNGKAPQAAFALGGAATDLATTITLTNNIRAALIANGIGS